MIDRFNGRYEWLSNFYPCVVHYMSVAYPTVEHAYQAAKTTDEELRLGIAQLKSPGTAKRMGAMLPLREDWGSFRYTVMWDLVCQKFSPKTTYGTWLLDTGDQRIVEGNYWHDNLWGDCSCLKCREVIGRNILGLFLMARRRELVEHERD